METIYLSEIISAYERSNKFRLKTLITTMLFNHAVTFKSGKNIDTMHAYMQIFQLFYWRLKMENVVDGPEPIHVNANSTFDEIESAFAWFYEAIKNKTLALNDLYNPDND